MGPCRVPGPPQQGVFGNHVHGHGARISSGAEAAVSEQGRPQRVLQHGRRRRHAARFRGETQVPLFLLVFMNLAVFQLTTYRDRD